MARTGAPKKHGMSGTPELSAWSHMHQRCSNESYSLWHRYGGRGIKVCERWSEFRAFLEDMGPRPGNGYSLDRINTDGNYEPGNCRWATVLEQMNNTSRNVLLEFRGETRTIPEWARHVGLSPKNLGQRMRDGWSVERALTTPKLPPSRRISNVVITCRGQTKTLSEWAQVSGINAARIGKRLRKGADPETAIFQKSIISSPRPNRRKRAMACGSL